MRDLVRKVLEDDLVVQPLAGSHSSHGTAAIGRAARALVRALEAGVPAEERTLLLYLGADAFFRDSAGQTTLHWAVTMGDETLALKLLQLGLEPRARANRRGPNTPGIRPIDMAIDGSPIAHMLNTWGRAVVPPLAGAAPEAAE